ELKAVTAALSAPTSSGEPDSPMSGRPSAERVMPTAWFAPSATSRPTDQSAPAPSSRSQASFEIPPPSTSVTPSAAQRGGASGFNDRLGTRALAPAPNVNRWPVLGSARGFSLVDGRDVRGALGARLQNLGQRAAGFAPHAPFI